MTPAFAAALLRRGKRLRSSAATARQALATAAVVIVGGSSSLLACPQCFGAQETSMVDGTKLGVLVMVVITLAVQGGFVGFFLYLRKRAKRIADIELDTEWAELQRPSRT
jgi:heme/copper-type cytochrome/quinol oxidase subunit 2